MGVVSFGAGIALGYILGNRNSSADLERARRAAAQTWQDPKVQEAVRKAEHKANELANDVAQRSQEALHAATDAVKQAIADSTSGSGARDESDAKTPDVVSDPALSTEDSGADWSDEGGSPRSAVSSSS